MRVQTKNNGAPAWELTELAVKKGQELAQKHYSDEQLVMTSLYLAHTVFSAKIGDAIQKDHPRLSASFAKEYLETWGVKAEEQEIIFNAIMAHHGEVETTSNVSEIVKNAECFKFVTLKGSLIWLHELGKRGFSYEESTKLVIHKMEQKKALLTLPDCMQEAEKNCQKIYSVFSNANNANI